MAGRTLAAAISPVGTASMDEYEEEKLTMLPRESDSPQSYEAVRLHYQAISLPLSCTNLYVSIR